MNISIFVRPALFTAACTAGFLISVLPAGAQRMDMNEVARSLGVECAYCHAGPGAAPVATQARSKMQVARAMMDMTESLNLTIENATGKAPGEVASISCITCHRGVPIPKTMDRIMFDTAMAEGGEEAIDVYHDLKERFYGRGVYDFSEQMLDVVINRMANVRPEPALYLAALNIEQYPDSADAYVTLSYVYTRLLDDASAIAALRKALEMEPDHSPARGRLSQLESYYPQLRNGGQGAQAGEAEDQQ